MTIILIQLAVLFIFGIIVDDGAPI